ncbi:uncharacterized protein Z520_08849 [Fonsecaea multimorphosa CBS 102226]|uniref:DUF2293 domain-containing protein n=1 Tax=Fonsecaea multimorphosa CBS 102226 TaxID=1442371 RepID=A0A0D2JPN9_9EURO|nr:uncharacterized protein Z520_08849 [Fonsecaea multimorphosa CBS 102226]KIX95332.1 hypothetical protein Z520_08849 [Fonsecaea multimorphosa CBS 102226]OAL21128.1 hypothetical protein AYO22_08285 [Fonsecaea multimorphosa]
MARVKQKVAKKGAAGASTRGGQVARQKRHKIAIGGDPQEKKLPTVVRVNPAHRRGYITSAYDPKKISFQERPPPGYTFIPAGNPELTNALKEFARRGDHKIYAVTITPHAARHELSREVHRVGFHFPTRIVDQVCAHYGIRLNSEGKVIDESNDDNFFSKVYRNSNGQRPVEEKDQITINTDAKQTIKDLFPNIPNNDLYQIIKTAFQLGDRRVGTANELPLVRRAQLSVVAHIRHNYTQYDKLLRQMPYNEARHMVEKETLVKLVEWRGGEDTTLESTTGAADDLLKEVIVISDEEASESDSEGVEPLGQDHVQVEELPSTSYGPGPGRPISPWPQLQPERILDYPPTVRTYRPSNAEIARRNQSRYAIWEQAKRDYHSNIAQRPVTVLERIYEPEPAPAPRVLVPLDPPAHSPAQIFHTQAPPTSVARVDYEPPIRSRQPSPPTYIQDANGILYERIDTRPRATRADTPQHYHKQPAPAMTGAQIRTRPSSPQDFAQRDSRNNADFDRGDGTILPSIEGPDGSYMSPRLRRNPFEVHSEHRETNPGREDGRNARNAAYIDLTHSSSQTPKRRRLEETQPIQERRINRRESPGRPVEHHYLPPQPVAAHAENRAANYGEPRSSPRLQQAISARETAYADRQPLYDAHDSSHSVVRLYEPIPATHELRETTTIQRRYHPQPYAAPSHDEVESIRPIRDLGKQPLLPLGQVYEPIGESRAYNSTITREPERLVREQYVQPIVQEPRVRYIYPDGSSGREPLQPLPPQRLPEYDRRAAPLHSYAR